MAEERPEVAVLLISDDAATRALVTSVLGKAGYTVRQARPEEARACTLEWPIEAILLDLSPPGTAVELARQMKAGCVAFSTPVLHLISSEREAEPLVHSLGAAADIFLTKPVTPSVLLSTVSTLVRLGRAYLVTEQERAELAEIVSQMPSGVILSNAEGELLMANARAREILCLAEIPRLPEERIRIMKPTVEGVRTTIEGWPLWRAIRTGERIVGEEFDFTCGGGAKVVVRVNAGPVRDPEGKIVAGVLTFTDITELKQAERARVELAESLNAEVHHRVKNNLAMVASILQMQSLEEQDPHVVSLLNDAATRLLTFASIHDQLQESQEGLVDLKGTISRLVEATRQAFEARGIAFVVEGVAVELSSRVATNLAIVANELITNAVKYCGRGPGEVCDVNVEVRVGLGVHAGRIVLSVWNSGHPVPEDFDPTRVGRTGLRLVTGIVVDQYGGTFSLRRHEGGTLAEVKIPREHLQ